MKQEPDAMDPIAQPKTSALIELIAVPWDAFVGAFLYFTLLTLVLLGGADLSAPVLAAAYLAVPVAYALLITGRLAQLLVRHAVLAAGDPLLVLH
jgi:hypothetical protein